jgi:DNA replication and repair protein RecF
MARKVQQTLTDETERFTVTYHCSMGAIGDFSVEQIKNLFQTIVEQKQDEELVRGTTLWGPHRDDLIFYLNGMDLKRYGSQGQQRSAALSLKLSEIKHIEEKTNDLPILLLDDVFSELDVHRQEKLLSEICDTQTIMTGTGFDDLIKEKIKIDKLFFVKEGVVTEEVL